MRLSQKAINLGLGVHVVGTDMLRLEEAVLAIATEMRNRRVNGQNQSPTLVAWAQQLEDAVHGERATEFKQEHAFPYYAEAYGRLTKKRVFDPTYPGFVVAAPAPAPAPAPKWPPASTFYEGCHSAVAPDGRVLARFLDDNQESAWNLCRQMCIEAYEGSLR